MGDDDRSQKYKRSATVLVRNGTPASTVAFKLLSKDTLEQLETRLCDASDSEDAPDAASVEPQASDGSAASRVSADGAAHIPGARSRQPIRSYEFAEIFSADIIRATRDRDEIKRKLDAATADNAKLKADLQRVPPPLSESDRRLRKALFAGALLGWLALIGNILYISYLLYSFCMAPAGTVVIDTAPPPPLLLLPLPNHPFDPIVGTERHGECTPGAATCYELPAFFTSGVPSSGGRRLADLSEPLKRLSEERAAQPVYIVTDSGRLDLVDLRNSMQRKVVDGEAGGDNGGYDFMCAGFLGFALDYCITHLRFENRSMWLDITGTVRLTAVNYSTALNTRFKVARALCGSTGTGADDRHFVTFTARYFYRVCVMLKLAAGDTIELCRERDDALVLQQLFEYQRGIDICRNGDHTGAIVEHIRAGVGQ